jgi:uncharacterized protein
MSKKWEEIGTVVGSTSTDSYGFVLSSLKGSVGDLVITEALIPSMQRGEKKVYIWGRIVSLDRSNPTFPNEAAAELNRIGALEETIGMTGTEHLHAEVQIMGCTSADSKSDEIILDPLTYPVKPTSKVLYPDAEIINKLLSGKNEKDSPIKIGTLINRPDVEIFMSGEGLASRHLAILAQTGGGKTVASRRIIAGLAEHGHPTVIFDPHGDYLGLSKNIEELKKVAKNKNVKVKLLTPKLLATKDTVPDAISELVTKLGLSMTEAQLGVFYNIVNNDDFTKRLSPSENNLLKHIEVLQEFVRNHNPGDKTQERSIGPIQRKLRIIVSKLEQMEKTNQKLRSIFQKKGLNFEDLPDPETNPQKIVSQNQISILYLGGYERVVQSTMVSIILEHLFNNRSSMTDGRIQAFSAVIEEAHNFVPSRSEEKGVSPSLMTIRRLLTEGRKFGTGVILISQRPGRLDETTLAQCNTFLVLKLVNPRDQNWVRNVMEQMSEQDAKWLKAFGKGQGFTSGYAVKFPLQVLIDYDKKLETSDLGRERFIEENKERWNSGGKEASEEMEKNSKEFKDILKKSTRMKI